MPKGLHRIRWIRGGEPEMQCAYCFEFMPLTQEFWAPEHGTQRCRTCWRTRLASLHKAAKVRYRLRLKAAKREHERAVQMEWERRNRSTLARYLRETA